MLCSTFFYGICAFIHFRYLFEGIQDSTGRKTQKWPKVMSTTAWWVNGKKREGRFDNRLIGIYIHILWSMKWGSWTGELGQDWELESGLRTGDWWVTMKNPRLNEWVIYPPRALRYELWFWIWLNGRFLSWSVSYHSVGNEGKGLYLGMRREEKRWDRMNDVCQMEWNGLIWWLVMLWLYST